MTITNSKKECRKGRIQQIAGTAEGKLLDYIDAFYHYEVDYSWGGYEPTLPNLTNEQRCLLRGWNALGFVSYSNTLGADFLTIKDWNTAVRKIYFKVMKENA